MPETPYVPRLLERYRSEVVGRLKERFQYKNPMQIPKLKHITLNAGLGEATTNARLLELAMTELGQITGQRPVITKAKKSVANFRLREGQSIGCTVTVRKHRMYEFFDRLVNVALPRVRDFRGLSPRAFDGRGNYTLGVREQVIFPEIDYNQVERVYGFNITIVTTAPTDEEGRELLLGMGMPLRT